MKKITINFNRLLLIVILLIVFSPLKAQDSLKKMVIATMPQYFFMHGLKFDIERNIKNTNHWIVVSPQFYFGTLFFDNVHEYDNGPDFIG